MAMATKGKTKSKIIKATRPRLRDNGDGTATWVQTGADLRAERTPMGHESRVVEVERFIELPNCHEETECGFAWSLYVKWDGQLKYTIRGNYEFQTKGGAMKQSKLIAEELGLVIGLTHEIER